MFLDDMLEEHYSKTKKNNREFVGGVPAVVGTWLYSKKEMVPNLECLSGIIKQGKNACKLFLSRHPGIILREDFYDIIVRDVVSDLDGCYIEAIEEGLK